MLNVVPGAIQQEGYAGDEDHKGRPARRATTLPSILIVVRLLSHASIIRDFVGGGADDEEEVRSVVEKGAGHPHGVR